MPSQKGLDIQVSRHTRIQISNLYFQDHGTVPPLLENTEQYICPHCPNIYTDKKSFNAHMRYKHLNPPRKYIKSQDQFQCPYCEKTYQVNKALRDHIIMKHEKSASHHCNICNGKFPSAIKFRDHMKKVCEKMSCVEPKTFVYICRYTLYPKDLDSF